MQTPVKSCGLGKPARRRTTRAPKAVDQDRNHASEPDAGRLSLTGLIILPRDTLGDHGRRVEKRQVACPRRPGTSRVREAAGRLGRSLLLSHACCPVVWVPPPELDQDKDITDQPIGENASLAGERRKMPSRQAADCVRNCVTTDHETRVPSQTCWRVLAGQLASGL